MHVELSKHIPAVTINYDTIDSVVKNVLNEHAPIEQRYVRANDAIFATKALRKVTMMRSKLRNR